MHGLGCPQNHAISTAVPGALCCRESCLIQCGKMGQLCNTGTGNDSFSIFVRMLTNTCRLIITSS